MKTCFTLLFVVLFNCIFTNCSAQQKSEKRYIDLVIKNNKIFALTASGHINIFDSKTHTVIDSNIHADTAILSISINNSGDIIVVEKNRQISILNEKDLSFKALLKSANNVYNTVFDHKNKIYLVTDKGITDPVSGKTYLPDTSYRLNKSVGWIKPAAVLMDKDDNIWIGCGQGEWGGAIFVFNTKTGSFIKPDIMVAGSG